MDAQPADFENARTGYLATVQLAIYEGTLAWRMMSTFATFNSVILAVAAYPLLVKSPPGFIRLASLVLSLVGTAGSVMWLLMVVRSRQYYGYWMRSARELEQHLGNRVQTLRRGQTFIDGGTVTIQNQDMALPRSARFRMAWGLYAVFVIFLVAYFTVLLFHVSRAIIGYVR